MKVRRIPVTLLELLLVMALIALVAGIVSIGMNKVFVDQRFRNEVNQIVDDLSLAQDLMLIMGSDIKVKFTQASENQGIEYYLDTDSKISESLQRVLISKKRVLKTIRGVFFDDKLDQNEQEGQLELSFISKGFVMSKGIMHLSISSLEKPASNVLSAYICFAGYPRPIKSRDTYEEASKDCDMAQHEAFIDTVSLDTYTHLPKNFKDSSVPRQEESSEETPKKEEKQPPAPQEPSQKPPKPKYPKLPNGE